MEAMGSGNDVVTGLMIYEGVCLFHLIFFSSLDTGTTITTAS